MADHVQESELTVQALAKKSYLRPEQRQDLQRSIDMAEERLTNPVVLEMTGGDPDALRKQVAREQEMLDAGRPPRLDSVGMAKVRKLEQYLREQITNGMPTFTSMERARPTDIDQHVAWEREHKRRVLAWKSCLQILDPNNTEPNFLSIARLRSDTVKGDVRKYVQNFDTIKWSEVVEEDLVRDMDDAAYHQFLEYKVLGWSKASICKELAWTEKMYAAALERLRNAMKEKQRHQDTDMNWGSEDAEDDEESPPEEEEAEDEDEDEEDEDKDEDEEGKDTEEPTRGIITDLQANEKPKRPSFPKKPRAFRKQNWLRDTLHEHGMSLYRFMKEYAKRTDTPAVSSMDKTGEWIAEILEKVDEALARLPQHTERPREVLGQPY